MVGVGYKMINFLIVTGIVIIMAWLIAVYRLDQKKSNLLMVIGGIVCIALFVYTKDWQTALICIIGSVVAAFCFPKRWTMPMVCAIIMKTRKAKRIACTRTENSDNGGLKSRDSCNFNKCGSHRRPFDPAPLPPQEAPPRPREC